MEIRFPIVPTESLEQFYTCQHLRHGDTVIDVGAYEAIEDLQDAGNACRFRERKEAERPRECLAKAAKSQQQMALPQALRRSGATVWPDEG